MKSIWSVLSAISVNEHTKKKGKFTYLSWTWAWATLKENYPTSTYKFLDNEIHADGSVTTHCQVTIEDLSHTMWLAVTDFNNKAIPNPSCDDIASNKMRCLTKCLAMFGLGHYIYANESFPRQPVEPVSVVSEEVRGIWNQALIDNDHLSLSALCALISHEAETELNASFLPGEISAGKKRVKELCSQGFTAWQKLIGEIDEMLESKDSSGLLEAVSELDGHEKKHLSSLLGEFKSKTLKELIAAQNQAIGGN